MTKKIHIPQIPEDSFKVLGINTEEKIWKLSFEINRILQLQLQREDSAGKKKVRREDSADQTLFSVSEKSFQKSEAEFFYLDDQSFEKYTVILCAGAGMKLPKPARPFRYFLFLSYTATDFQEQEWNSWMEKLKASPVVLTICDLTHLKDLKNILS